MSKLEPTPHYRDGRHYDLLNSDIVSDIPFYVEEAVRAGGSVLELACGTGRLTIPIAQSGVSIVGLDQCPSMLARARAKASVGGIAIPFVESDCRKFELERKFALIFMAFNSRQRLHDPASLEALFRSVRRPASAGRQVHLRRVQPAGSDLGSRGHKPNARARVRRPGRTGHHHPRADPGLRRRVAGKPDALVLQPAGPERPRERLLRRRPAHALLFPAGTGPLGSFAGFRDRGKVRKFRAQALRERSSEADSGVRISKWEVSCSNR